MIVEELIEQLRKENPKNEVWVESQDGTNLLDIREVTDGAGGGETFTVLILEESVSNGDYLEPLK